ncbi:MAG: SPOR domain-containing protein [SAR324 cluster bacterium]|nr:SPOR domain-containing protein [SAR324 cluster bacterium]
MPHGSRVRAKNRFSELQATNWVTRINRESDLPGEAYRKALGKDYQISLGSYSDKQTADRVLKGINQKFKGELVFEKHRVRQKIAQFKIRLENYDTREAANQVKKELSRKDKRLQDIWVVETP